MAHRYEAEVVWTRDGATFADNRYSRAHLWRFDGGTVVPASSAPSSVPPPLSREDAVDPEEAFVAALSSCHMLFFLSFAARAGHVVESYRDKPVGVMTANESGRLYLSEITLRPAIVFSGGNLPDAAAIAILHERAHAECYLANSIRGSVVIASGSAA